MELDYGVGRIYVKGDENTSFGEVVDEFNAQKDSMVDDIRDLKRFERELQEEFAPDADEIGDPLDSGRGVN